MESFQGLRGGGRDHNCRCGHMKLLGTWFAALRKVNLHQELDKWDLGNLEGTSL
jgi:hypothetical protein